MLQDSNNEYKIPENEYSPELNGSVCDENLESIYDIYRSEANKPHESDINDIYPDRFQTKDERLASLTIKRLNVICVDIEKARSDKLKKRLQPSRHSNDVRVFTRGVAKLFFNKGISDQSFEKRARNDLITKESVIGAAIFGLKSNSNERDEFFCEGHVKDHNQDDVDSWLFHQEKTDTLTGNHTSRTLHYEVLPTGVLLVGNGYIQSDELDKFVAATEMYYERVMKQIYSGNEFIDHSHRSSQRNSKIGQVIRLFKNDNHTNGQAAS